MGKEELPRVVEARVQLLHSGFNSAVTALVLHDANFNGAANVVVGTASGRVVALANTLGDAVVEDVSSAAEESTENASVVWERETLRPIVGFIALGDSASHGLPELAVVTAEGVSLQAPAPSVVAAKISTVAILARELAALRCEIRGGSINRED